MRYILLCIVIGFWFLLGDPPRTVASWFWGQEAAPWERVDAFFYPNRSDLSAVETRMKVGTVSNCRDWAHSRAASNGDPSFQRSDYECGIGKPTPVGGLKVYRATVR